jgi:hypothetical protein
MTDSARPSSSDDERLRSDFAAMRRNSALRSPSTIPELIAFLTSARIFAQKNARIRPIDAGQCKL